MFTAQSRRNGLMDLTESSHSSLSDKAYKLLNNVWDFSQ